MPGCSRAVDEHPQALQRKHIIILGRSIANQITDKLNAASLLYKDAVDESKYEFDEAIANSKSRDDPIYWWRRKRTFVAKMDKCKAEVEAAQAIFDNIDNEYLVEHALEDNMVSEEIIREYIRQMGQNLQKKIDFCARTQAEKRKSAVEHIEYRLRTLAERHRREHQENVRRARLAKARDNWATV